MSSPFTTDYTTLTTSLDSNTTPFSDIEIKCRTYYKNSTGFLNVIKDFEGIPENLLVNAIAWFALVLVFTFLRRIGDYGRFGLIKNDEERWAKSFFYPKTSNESSSDNEAYRNYDQPNVVNGSTTSLASQEIPQSVEYKDNHLFSWILHMFKLKDKHINEKCGKDAIYYLVFQRYLLVYMLIIAVLSLAFLLPINILSKDQSSKIIFSSTTIVNVNEKSPILWVHLVLTWIFLVIGLVFIVHFSKRMQYIESDYISRTVLITYFPSEFCDEELIRKHFSEAYPDLKIKDIQFAFDITKLTSYDKVKRSMTIGRVTSQKIYERTGQRPLMQPFHFGSLVELCCCCCCNSKLTDSIEFYTKKENDIKVKMAEYKETILKKPLGILFITFEDKKMAEHFLKDYNYGFITHIFYNLCHKKNLCSRCYLCKYLPKDSSISEKLKVSQWSAKYAPSPSNLKWENISKIGLTWWFRFILINLILIIVMIFFTTPSILIEKFSESGMYFNVTAVELMLPSYVAEILPSLILRLLTALLPVIVAYTAVAELHLTKSAENRSMMFKTFILLLFMVLILPTLGLTSINAFFEWLGDKRSDVSNIKWKCVSDNGAFFLKYVTTCSLIGTALDLLRLPELLLYLLKMLWSRSSAERLAVRMQVAFEFDYGVQYAWILTVFTVTLCFSAVCPLITPFGLLYLLLKHLVDRYNIYFAYTTTKVDKNIHKSAVTFFILSLFMLQFCILFFLAIRNKGEPNSYSIATVQYIVVFFSFLLLLGRVFFGLFKRFTPFIVKKKTDQDSPNNNFDNDDSDEDFYLDKKGVFEINNDFYNNQASANSENALASNNNANDENIYQVETSQPERTPSIADLKKRQKPNKRKQKFINFESPFIPTLLRQDCDFIKLDTINESSQGSASTAETNASVSPSATFDRNLNQNIEDKLKVDRQDSNLDPNQIEIEIGSTSRVDSPVSPKSSKSNSSTVSYRSSKSDTKDESKNLTFSNIKDNDETPKSD